MLSPTVYAERWGYIPHRLADEEFFYGGKG
nr:MAG TPA: hypothetical protein [Herelleviridae sp.]